MNKTTTFKKGKGKKNFKKDGKGVAAPGKPVAGKKSKNGPKPETECFYCKVDRSILDIHYINVYFTSVYGNPSVFDTSSVAKISKSKRELQNKQRLETELESNTKGLLRTLVRYTSITCISNIPIPLPSFFSAKYLGQFRFH